MASGPGALHLSLLSRGVGEVSKNGHERIDVILEPQDYFNFVDDSRRIYLPPIQSHYAFGSPAVSTKSSGTQTVALPKTFTTRKGALLLFSEDMAMKHRQTEVRRRHRKHSIEEESTEESLTSEESDLKTVDDLAKSILSYGSHLGHTRHVGNQEKEDSSVFLKFVHSRRRDYFDRQIRPGFSAKRYLSTWTKSWDDSILEKVISKGYLTEKSLFYYNPLLPHLSRRLNDDMSHYPAPYKLMRSMLMSPGSLSGYTFYRIRPESAESIDFEEEEARSRKAGSIKVVSVKDGVQREVTYGSLDRRQQEDVLTDLLVKSAVHYAMKKQQEYMGDYETKITEITEEPEYRRQRPTDELPPFDMKNAVESLLDNQKTHRQTLEPDFQEDKSESSLHSGSLKGSKVRKISPRQDQGPGPVGAVVRPIQSTTYPSDSEVSRESMYNGNVPVTTLQDGVGSSSRSSIPPLPPIHPGGHMVLTPIGEASREHTQAISLPDYDRYGKGLVPKVHVEPPTPQHTMIQGTPRSVVQDPNLATQPEARRDEEEAERWRQAAVTARDSREGMQRPPLSHKEVIQPEPERSEREERRRRREEKRRARLTQQNIDFDSSQGPLVAGGSQLMSSSESLGPGSTASMLSGQNLPRPPQWKGSTQSLRSYGSRKGPSEESHSDVIWESSQAPSLRGSTESPMTIMSKRLESPRSYKTRKTTESNKTQSSQSQPQTQSSGSVVEGESVHGSVVFGPGGELIQVGGTIKPTYKEDRHRDTSDESDVEVPDEWRESRGYRPHSGKYSESLKRFAVKREIDYTSGDIDATLSLHSWAYGARDELISHAGSMHSLPTMGLDSDMKYSSQEMLAQKEIWEDLRNSSFIGTAQSYPQPDVPPGSLVTTAKEGETDISKSRTKSRTPSQGRVSSQSFRSLSESTPRSQSEARRSSRESPRDLQRSQSTPLSQAAESGRNSSRTKSRPLSDISKGRRQLQSQLSQIEGETEMIREQTEISHYSEQPTEEAKVSQDEVMEPVEEDAREATPKVEEQGEVIDEDQEAEDTSTIIVPSAEHESSDEIEKEPEQPQPEEMVEPEETKELTPKEPTPPLESPKESIKGEPTPVGSEKGEVTPQAKSVPQSPKSEVQSPKSPSRLPTPEEIMPDEMIGSSSKSAASTDKMTEEEVIRALTEHARKVSGSTLSHAGSGYDLEQDIKKAANIWMESHPVRVISRSQSMQDVADKSIIQEVLNAQKRNSAGPTVAEYRDQIRENLVTAIAKAAGLEEGTIPLDADISPELLQALANQSLTPEDIEIVRDEESGRSIIRSRQHMAELMGGVKEGHIYTAAGGKEAGKGVSIPSERMSNADVGELDIIKYVTEEQGSEKAPSVKGPSAQASDKSPSEKAPSVRSKSPAKSLVAGSIPEAAEQESPGQKTPKSLVKSQVSFKEGATPDEFQTAIDAIEKERDSSPKTDAVSVKSGKSGKSVVSLKEDKSQVSDKSAKKPASPEKRDEFVVGKVKQTKELEKLYGQPVEVPPKQPTPPEKITVRLDKFTETEKTITPEPEPERPKTKSKSAVKKVKEPEKVVEKAPPVKMPEIPATEPRPTVQTSGRVDHMEENKKIYGMKSGGKAAGKPKEKKPKVPAPPKKAEAKKGKKKAKGKKKEEEPAETVEEVPPKEPTPQPEKEPTPPPPPSPPKSVPKTPTESERTSSPYTFKSEEEDDQEFIIIRDEETPSPEPVTKLIIPTQPSSPESDEKDGKSGEEEEDSEAERLRMISNREARAAKRAAAAEKRKQDVEKKRREREEQQKREKEEAERQERLKQELEENRRRKEEERRLRKEKEAEAEAQEMQEEIEREKRKRAEQEREKRMKEEYQRKLEDMKKKQIEEEARKAEEKRIRDEEERIRREKEEEMLAEMAEQERLEYERRKKEEEEERIRKEEEEKRKREEEAKRAMEEARRLAEEMARKQAELEARLRFNRTLQLEAHGMEHTQDVTRAFVFSYFELLQWLGLDIPEFELLKLNQY